MPIVAAYTGTFDPITLGHADVIARAAKLCDRMLVAVAKSSSKAPLFPQQQRLELAKQALAALPNVEVLGYAGLTVDFMREHAVDVVVRGIRGVIDFDYEQQMARMNRQLLPGLETIFLAADPGYSHISSTLVRDIARHGGDVSALVHPHVLQAVKAQLEHH